MRPIRILAALIVAAACSFAQRQHSGPVQAVVPRSQPAIRMPPPPVTNGTHVVFPSAGVTFPATGTNQPPFSITNPNFIPSLAGTVSGQVGGRNGYRRFHHQGAFPYGYAYPVVVGGYGDYGYGTNPDPGYTDSGYVAGYATDPASGPQVIINQNFLPEQAHPVMRDYRGAGDSSGVQVYQAPGREPLDTSADNGTDYYLIAFKDDSIYSAFAYWVEGDTLHYVTPQRVHNQVSLSLVDRELTERLNRNRAVQVKLPN